MTLLIMFTPRWSSTLSHSLFGEVANLFASQAPPLTQPGEPVTPCLKSSARAEHSTLPGTMSFPLDTSLPLAQLDCWQPHYSANTFRICNLLSCTGDFVQCYPLRVYSHACVSDSANQCDTLFPRIQEGTQIPPPHSVQQALTVDTQIHYCLFVTTCPVNSPYSVPLQLVFI